VKPQTSQTCKRLHSVAAASENADKDNGGGSGENGILGKRKRRRWRKKKTRCTVIVSGSQCKPKWLKRFNLTFSVRAVAE
jgi:hypothetical protein